MSGTSLTISILHEVFVGDGAEDRLTRRLTEAVTAGAAFAVLPELPLDNWVPCSKVPRDEDAEPAEAGPRQSVLGRAAATAGLAVLGGAIVKLPDGTRRNRALVYDRTGVRIADYDKLHVPFEEGYWEAAHYDNGTIPPRPFEVDGFPVGVQICSDLFRPTGCHLLGAAGALAIFAPRATPVENYERWLRIIRANAITSCAYLISINRPAPEAGVAIGGDSVVAAPDGTVLTATDAPLTTITLKREVVEDARKAYPGYLPIRSELYAKAWGALRSPVE